MSSGQRGGRSLRVAGTRPPGAGLGVAAVLGSLCFVLLPGVLPMTAPCSPSSGGPGAQCFGLPVTSRRPNILFCSELPLPALHRPFCATETGSASERIRVLGGLRPLHVAPRWDLAPHARLGGPRVRVPPSL